MSDDQYSYIVVFERRDGSPDEKYYYDSEQEAREHFRLVNDPNDKKNAELYYSICLIKFDWINRRTEDLDSVGFGD